MQQKMIKTLDKVYPVQQQMLCCWTIKKKQCVFVYIHVPFHKAVS